MPPALIDNFLEMTSVDTNRLDKIAFVTDLRTGKFFDKLARVIDDLRSRKGVDLTVLYIEASAAEIVRRYNEVRRNHPLTGGEASVEVIEEEKEELRAIRAKADLILDTTNLKVAEMNAELDKLVFGGSGSSNFAINISSFGFKYGIPSEADVMFDVRFMPNPYWVPSLRRLTGNNKRVKDFVFRHEISRQFVDSTHILLRSLVQGYINEGKYHLNIALGCTGGHHRSVAIANALAEEFKKDGMRVRVNHRDLDLQNKKK
jgi:UPF0042 nucleotide-binding protein